MTPLLDLADAELAQLIATPALLPVGACIRSACCGCAGGSETSLLNAIAAAQRQAAVVPVQVLRARVVPAVHRQAVFACRHCHRLGHASQLETPHGRGLGAPGKSAYRWRGTDDPKHTP
jgi:hypothetical protein